jgi:hypothetical protein
VVDVDRVPLVLAVSGDNRPVGELNLVGVTEPYG